MDEDAGMTPKRFAALAALISMRIDACKAGCAAYLVLVDGMRQADAARAVGITPQAVCNAVKRVERADKLAKTQ